MRAQPSVYWQEAYYCRQLPALQAQELCRLHVSIFVPTCGRFDDFVGSHHV